MRDTHTELEIVYEGKVYDMSIKHSDKEPKLTRTKHSVPSEVKQIDVKPCDECAGLMFNGVCMNKDCIHAAGNLQQAATLTLPQPEEEPQK